MLKKRLIACLDVADGRVVKGVRFRGHEDVGDILELAQRYGAQGIDELVFYDITASPQGRGVAPDWVARVARRIDIPFCVAGGIRSVAQAAEVLAAGADKISVNTPALENPDLIDALAARFGSQCVVVGIDSIRDADGVWRVRSHTGDPDTMRQAGRATLDWLQEAVARGAGEIVLNCMGADGTRDGYDLEQLAAARAACPVPLIASGGAGSMRHFTEVFENTDVDGALAASVFHKNLIAIAELKAELARHGIPVRL
ncbi:imidazole glycerol phosphate synthase subunit HisF [Arenimonas maotaiensis]|uniref:Imidazole glycerol phosphate synthase subunit HisF n=1 Tax=Arenimonas maotaiensis TaxID=1446479 RepID=A0A917FJE1_9GAMM|nr:imidazole glycerol phosphate synthase subunit HisF [Arenimonas maotaiensis]GGF85916.1 imidazole glycerol phosphate synthase subunit HisF [Arenimonas maotaiensis]